MAKIDPITDGDPGRFGLKEKAGISFGKYERSAGLLLRITQLKVFDVFYELLEPSGIRLGEFSVLHTISKNPGIRQGVMADVLQVKWPSMTKLVRSLEARGLVTRNVPVDDRRSVELVLTDEGRAVVESSVPKIDAANQVVFSMLDEGEYDQLLTLLRKVSGMGPSEE